MAPATPRLEARWTVAVLLASALAIVAGAAVRRHGLDTGLFLALNGWRGAPDTVWEMLSVAGLGLTALAVLSLGARRHPGVLAALAWCFVVSGGLTQLVKRLLVSPRPPSVLDPGAVHVIGTTLHWGSMPSGHAVTAAAVVTILWTAGGRFWRRPWFLAGAIVLALWIGASRIATGAHWPADVLAGAVLGWASACISVDLARRSGLERWFQSAAGQAFLAVVQLGTGAAMILLDSGFEHTGPFQWILGTATLFAGVRSIEDAPGLTPGRGGTEVQVS
jgi:membrane-associated phospholipid phosphatase